MEKDLNEFVGIDELKEGYEVEVYDESGAKVDAGLVRIYSAEETFDQPFVDIYSKEKEKLVRFSLDRDYKFKIISSIQQDIEGYIRSGYVNDLRKDLSKHKVMYTEMVEKFESTEEELNKKLRYINYLTMVTNRYYKKMEDIITELNVYDADDFIGTPPIYNSDLVLIEKEELDEIRMELHRLKEESQ